MLKRVLIHKNKHMFSFIGKKPTNTDSFSIMDNYIIVMLSLLMQTWKHIAPKSTRKRIAFITVITAGMLIFFIWDAQLISYLSTPHYHLPFHSLHELLKKTNYKVHKTKAENIQLSHNLFERQDIRIFTRS